MVKSKCNSDDCLLLDFNLPCRFTTLTTSERVEFKFLSRQLTLTGLTVIGDQDGVLLQLGDGHDVHQLVPGDHCLGAVLLLQLVAVEPGAARVEVNHVELERPPVVAPSHVHTN